MRKSAAAVVIVATIFHSCPSLAEATLGEQVKVKSQKWRLDGFGNVMVVDLSIENSSKINLKDFVVECETVGQSGTSLGKVRKTVFDTLPAGKTKKFKNINMGFVNSQSKRAGCEIIGALPEGYK